MFCQKNIMTDNDINYHQLIELLISCYTDKSQRFVVSLDAIAKAACISKSNIVTTLKRGYCENQDYVMQKARRQGEQKYGANNYKCVLTTLSCIKQVIMRSRGKNIKAVQDVILRIDRLFMQLLPAAEIREELLMEFVPS